MSNRQQIDPLFVLLGAHGDITIALPALKKWADENGRPANLMVSEDCAGLLEGCSYVKTTVVKADFHKLWPMLSYLKTELPQVPVKCLQFYGLGHPKELPSFWHEQMWLAGLLGGGEGLPLVFDRRDKAREDALRDKWLVPYQQTILFCGSGNSSPMKYPNALYATIREAFPDCNVVDLSEVRAERIYDLLGLYDHAAALVSIDTVHLHLSKASKVPVFALARDYPDRWHGTPQLDRFAWYCRYGQVMERADELIQAMRDHMGHVYRPSPRKLKELPRGAYNPSIIEHEGREIISYRHHPDDRNWKTQLMLDGLPVRFPFPVATCAHEDMRLFHFRGELWASYVCSRGSAKDPRCVVGYGELVQAKDFWAIRTHFQPDVGWNDWRGMEKNAVGFEHDNHVHLIWRSFPHQEVLRMEGFECVERYETDAPTWPYGEIRGGTSPLPFKDGQWIRFFHSRVWDKENGKPWRYHIGALVMEDRPPFRTLAVSKKPILSGDESGDPMIPHWKQNVVFPLGAVPDGDGWKVSLGINDAHCAVIHLTEGQLNL